MSAGTPQPIATTDRTTSVAQKIAFERSLCERSLYDFMQRAWHVLEDKQPFIPNWHIEGICRHLEALNQRKSIQATAGKYKNLLINVPPGTSKSRSCNVFWPAWSWIQWPHLRWLFISHSSENVMRDARDCRTLMESPWYRDRWGDRFEIDPEKRAVHSYANDKGGSRFSTTMGAQRITGQHPHRIVIDDPHDPEAVLSEENRRKDIDWYREKLSTRGVAIGVRRVLIMQRLHQRDMSGYLIDEHGSEWEKIILPMRYEPDRMNPTVLGWNDIRTEPGELLASDFYTEPEVRELEINLGSYGSASQLQQRPAPREGGIFKAADMTIVDRAPVEFDRIVRYWDKAGSRDIGDYTAGVLMARAGLNVYILDVIRGQWTFADRESRMDVAAALDRDHYGSAVVIWIEQEPGSSGKDVAAIEKSRLASSGHRVRTETRAHQGSKIDRADALACAFEAGRVFLLRGEWNRAFIDEACLFPKGEHDDQVDAASGAYLKLARKSQGLVVGVGSETAARR